MTSNNNAVQINKPSSGWINVSVMGWAHLASDFYCDILPILLPVLALRFGFSYSECGALFMAFQILANFIQPVIGLAAVIIGEALLSRFSRNFAVKLAGVVGGGIIYYIVYQTVIYIGLDTDLLKMLSAIVVAIFLAVPYWKKKYFSGAGKKNGSQADTKKEDPVNA